MKNILLLFILTIAQLSVGQEIEINEKNLSKKWVFADIINDDTEEKKAEIREMLEATVLTFREDKTYTFEFIAEITGTWTLDATKKEITTKDRRGTNIWHIHSLTKDKAVLSRNDAKQKIIFKPE
ncbi:hypothetical protein OGH69_05295 [Flavobacterium sp. MFBS3-15]|uniref:hypothetical protein n=1 Tax=Flavobacterium sp. MFBS3-15 TaxID=2989816 RepID=UPI0022365786|nr:hypothetical protein [Flavobacterium sp. MFBS3-15]MCW4468370.1 hypothetical protein [Flavobacterium sp. MFBS3-15]